MDPLLSSSTQRASFKSEMASCSQGAPLLGVIFGWLRRQKLAKKLRIYVAREKSGRRYATTAVKLLNSCEWGYGSTLTPLPP